MLSKVKGQILRLAATMHILFHLEKEEELSEGIIEDAVLAAINYMLACIQHTAYMTGRSTVVEEAGRFNITSSKYDLQVRNVITEVKEQQIDPLT